MGTNYKDIQELNEYIKMVENEGQKGFKKVSKWQKKLIKFIKKVFKNEELYIDKEQLERYLSLQKYFPYKLFAWEKFVFTLHNCTYTKEGKPRFPDLIIFVGRGAGKNGYLAFEDFCLISPYNPIKHYDIDICAMSEEQAKMSFEDIYNVLEANRKKLMKFFYWNKQVIIGRKNGSKIKYRTNNAKTKDGLRSGKVDFDEVHAYENYINIKVYTTALGKKPHPRRTYVSSNGDVCEGVYDDLLEKAKRILNLEIEDNGTLCFLCTLDNEKEVEQEENWYKANPSLQYLDTLLDEIRKEYKEWKEDKSTSSDFMTKRMGIRQGNRETEVASWEDIQKTNQEIIETRGEMAIFGIDYTKINDFAAVGKLTKKNGKFFWKQMSWVCKNSNDLGVIKFPIEEAEKRGELQIVDALEIPPDLLVEWIREEMKTCSLQMVALDDYRYELMRKALMKIGVSYENQNIKLVRPSDKIKVEPIIDSAFRNHNIVYGDSMIMRWYTNNTKKVKSKKYGNYEYQKINAKSRKTDGFFAFVAAMTQQDLIIEAPQGSSQLPPIFTM